MAKEHKIKCPECGTEFEFSPEENVVVNLNRMDIPKLNRNKEVTAYLTCPKGHTKPYKVTKSY